MGFPVQIISQPQTLTIISVDQTLAIKTGSRVYGGVKIAVDPQHLSAEDRETLNDCKVSGSFAQSDPSIITLPQGYARQPLPAVGHHPAHAAGRVARDRSGVASQLRGGGDRALGRH